MSLNGAQADQLALMLLGLALAVAALVAFRLSTKLAFVCWVLTIAFVPVYFGIPFIVVWVPATLAGGLVLLSSYPWGEQHIGVLDGLVAAFFATCLVPVLVPGAWTRTSVFVALTQWALAFTLGRVLPARLDVRWMYGAVAVVMAAAGALALVEFLTHWNPFVSMYVPWNSSPVWRGLQVRGGIVRAEGAFGHSIALGCSLALAVPLTFGARFSRAARNSILLLLLLGSVVTFSRVGMIGAVVGLVLSIVAGAGIPLRTRVSALIATAVAAIVVLPMVLDTFAAASEESTVSASYRLDLLTLVPKMQFFGFSDAARFNAEGELTFAGFQSIDSALILLGLTYGWFALILALVLLCMAIGALVMRRAEPPTIAIVASIPALMTVALITQYAMMFWFVAGLAVAAQSQLTRASGAPADRPADPLAVASIAS